MAVLEAAATLFARHGFQGVAVADIAVLSGVRKPNLLYHFSSKEDLWKATIDWVFGHADEALSPARAEFAAAKLSSREERWAAFRHLIASYYEVCQRVPAYVLIPLVEGAAPSWRTEWIAERHLKRHVANFDGYAQTLVADGMLPDVEPLHLQNILTGGLQLSIGLAPLWSAALSVDSQSVDFLEAYASAVFALLEASHSK